MQVLTFLHEELAMNILKCVKFAVALCLSGLAVPQAMACFTVYNAGNRIAYSSMDSPIDMSYQIHERLPAAFPGGHMVFGSSTDCPAIDLRKASPELGNTSVASAAATPRARSAKAAPMSRAARERAQDALTK